MTCDHVVGFALCAFRQHGERDRLVVASESVVPDDKFAFCPRCGASLSFSVRDNKLPNPYGRLADEIGGGLEFVNRDRFD